MAVSPRTANALYNVHRGYWQTHYQQQFTGNGPQNILKLDNFDEICKGEPDSLVSAWQILQCPWQVVANGKRTGSEGTFAGRRGQSTQEIFDAFFGRDCATIYVARSLFV